MAGSMDWRSIVVAVVALVGTIGALLVTRYVVSGGEPTDLGETSSVPPRDAVSLGDHVGYAYRTSCRFADYIRLHIADGTVEVTGPRVPVPLYWFFIGSQLVAYGLIPASLLAAVLFGRGRFVLIALGLVLVHWIFSSVGAGLYPQLGAMQAIQEPGGYSRVSYPLASVRDVRIGKGWSRRGLAAVILPFVGGIDMMAAGHGVSWEAPDPTSGRYAVYTFHAYDEAEAREVAEALGGR